MIIADSTIFAGVLAGKPAGLDSLLNDLWKKRRVGAPPIVLAELLAVETTPHRAERLRAWAVSASPLAENADAWTAAGDIAARLAYRGIRLPLVEAYVLALCVRESAQLWSLNPIFDEACQIIPVQRFKPTGL